MVHNRPLVKIPPPRVECHRKGKKSVSWRNDMTILTRLVAVAEIYLRGGTLVNIANAFDYSLTTAKRDIARVKTLWREHFLRELADLLAESIAQYRLVQTKAWAEYDRRPSANYLRVIIEAQSKIDDIQGNQAPKEMQIEEIDIETVRKKRWEDVMDMLPALLDSEEENG